MGDPGRNSLPAPPVDLLRRIGPMDETDPVGGYERTGAEDRALIEAALPPDWSWQGKRVLDFGCGAGRILRQLAAEAGEAELWGCDLDRPSIAWLRENLSPPFRFFASGEAAALPQEDGYFDLIYAFSVYTHFTDNWAEWLLEHHRVLADGGLLLVTFLGEGVAEALTGEPWDEDRIGMNPLLHGKPWEEGGPIALNSPWWIRAHWGRAFEILELRSRTIDDDQPRQGLVLMRRRPVRLTVEDLTRIEPDEPREIAALQHHARQLRDETLRLRAGGEARRRIPAPLRAAGRLLGRSRS